MSLITEQTLMQGLTKLGDQIDAIKAERDELLKAVKWALPFAEKFENPYPGGPRQRLMEAKLAEIRKVIARAEGKR